MVMFWGPSHSFVAFLSTVTFLFQSFTATGFQKSLFFHFVSLDWTSLSRGGRENERTVRVNEMASPCSPDLPPQFLWITFKTLFFMPWAGKSVFPHSFSLSNRPVQAFLFVSPVLCAHIPVKTYISLFWGFAKLASLCE